MTELGIYRNGTDYPLAGNITIIAGPYIPPVALALTGVSACLSILGASLIFYSYIKLVHQRNTVRLLLVYLSFADLLTATGNLAGTIRYEVHDNTHSNINESSRGHNCKERFDPVCTGQSFVTTFSSMCSFFWTVAIAIFFYAAAVQGVSPKPRRILIIFHVICWGIPGVITITALATGALGEDLSMSSGAWCWIDACMSRREQLIWMIFSGKGWEISAYILSASLFVLVKYDMVLERRLGHTPFYKFNVETEYSSHKFRFHDQNFLYLPLLLYLLRMWGTIRFFIAAHELSTGTSVSMPQKLDDALLVLHCFGDSAQAALNCLFYVLCDKQIRDSIFLCKPDLPDEKDSEISDENKPLIKRQTSARYSNGMKDFIHTISS